MKATEQYSPVVLFIMLCKLVRAFRVCRLILSVVIQMKKLTVDGSLKCDHSNESYGAVLSTLSCVAVHNAVQGRSNFCLWIS